MITDPEIERIFVEKELRIQKMWNSIDYKKYDEYLKKRTKMLNDLYLVYPYIELQAESLNGLRSKLFGFDTFDWRMYAPAIHYRILPNEIVIEIEEKDVEELKKIIKALKRFKAKFLVGYSGNRGFHIHVILSPPNGDVENFARHPEARKFTVTLYDALMSYFKLCGVDTEVIDRSVMTASNHTIRSFYSLNMKGRKWKTPIMHDSYQIWHLPKKLYRMVLDKMKKENDEVDVDVLIVKERNGNKPVKSNKIAWIEWVIRNPHFVSDGRRVLLMYAIIPYLVNVVKLGPNKVYETCVKWVQKTQNNSEKSNESEYRSLIKHEIKSYAKSGVLPMSRKKFFETFSQVGYLKGLIDGGGGNGKTERS